MIGYFSFNTAALLLKKTMKLLKLVSKILHAWAGGNWVILRNHLLALNMGLIWVLIIVLCRGLGGREETRKDLVFKASFRKVRV